MKPLLTRLGGLFGKKEAPRQTCHIYCPTCRTELIAANAHAGLDADGLEVFTCLGCRTTSRWLFDAPVPLLIVSEVPL